MHVRRTLRVKTLATAMVHWSVDGWRTARDPATHDTTLGVHVVDLPTMRLRRGDRVISRFIGRRWTDGRELHFDDSAHARRSMTWLVDVRGQGGSSQSDGEPLAHK